MSDSAPFREYLTVREHLDPDKHWIGETLPAPTQGELAATVGTLSGPGDSPFPARADHMHKVDPTLLPSVLSWTPTIANFTLGTGGTVTSRAVKFPITPTFALYAVSVHIVCGTGTPGPTGDMNASLPVACIDKFVGHGHLAVSAPNGRMELLWHTINTGSTSGLIRPLVYRPTDATAARVVETSVLTMANITPAITWAANDWIMLSGQYFG